MEQSERLMRFFDVIDVAISEERKRQMESEKRKNARSSSFGGRRVRR